MTKSYQDELQQWLTLIEQNHPSDIEMGLDRTLTVYTRLRKGRLAKQVVLVAGTNGKGSTIAVLERLLLEAGLSVGVYSSPHIHIYNERIRINGELIDDKRLVESFQVVEKARRTTPLTYFECGTLGALYCLERARLDVVLLEVGLGGRLDAVNIVDPDLSIITSVDIDHVEWLGDNRESIGFEKAGIFRQGVPAIYGGDNPPESVIQQANAQNIDLHIHDTHFGLRNQPSEAVADYSWVFDTQPSQSAQRVVGYLRDQTGSTKEILMPYSLLPESNILTAIQAMACLGHLTNDTHILKALDGFAVKGRFEVYGSQPLVLLDVGHNPHAARFLSRRLSEIKGGRPVYAVFSVLTDKDVNGIVEGLNGQIDHWYIAPLACPRAMKLPEICNALSNNQQQFTEYDGLNNAFNEAVNVAKESDGIVMCFGSFHVVSDIN
ncbi:bifunctional tetrahydrofolate synthase/dihydrofolate synthase [Alkalimarinus alittae]|uniref:Dihydrofolate synthase/folylpolyglutamate synthase n=1 Tax=Alkalimarinus alittae TaxID=2961619 RepID=A0ABY6N6V3_9ALTE|nr:bifunctional tetrahydrofolate synthase/dihydrofolate synthase [Alkalimarinus alittae]UZE97858.1 bifunctional tetrahydrofolate synthase/dihydrofolate synthase [Alkalimarinus alittae]